MGHQKGQIPSNVKKIRTYYCSFCRLVVNDKESVKMPLRGKRFYIHLCPKCGGSLGKYFEGQHRHTVRG